MTDARPGGHGRLHDRVALITGGASGIGEATCRVFAAEGARVAVLDRDTGAAMSVASSLAGDTLAVGVDITDSPAVDVAFEQVIQRWGRVDAVVHSAGIDDPVVKERMAEQVARGEPVSITVDLSDERWHRMISVNLDGAFYVLRSALRHMRPAGSGSIVMVGSQGGVEGVRAYPHYAAAKAGLHAMCRSVAVETAALGIRINAIAPGPVETPMRKATPAIIGGTASTATPMGRAGKAEEIATVALFLVSDDSTFITGQTLLVNGGRLTI
jgi:3-oxoacyl-[acyl-carrier protein] reductase